MDNKLFWKTIKPSFSDKIVTGDRIHLTENGEVGQDLIGNCKDSQ